MKQLSRTTIWRRNKAKSCSAAFSARIKERLETWDLLFGHLPAKTRNALIAEGKIPSRLTRLHGGLKRGRKRISARSSGKLLAAVGGWFADFGYDFSDELGKLEFQPGLIAVCGFDLLKPQRRTRGGIRPKVRVIWGGRERNHSHIFRIAERLHRDGAFPSREDAGRFVEDCFHKNNTKWMAPYMERNVGSANGQEVDVTPACPSKALPISKRMASYWRLHPKYQACIAALSRICGQAPPLPRKRGRRPASMKPRRDPAEELLGG